MADARIKINLNTTDAARGLMSPGARRSVEVRIDPGPGLEPAELSVLTEYAVQAARDVLDGTVTITSERTASPSFAADEAPAQDRAKLTAAVQDAIDYARDDHPATEGDPADPVAALSDRLDRVVIGQRDESRELDRRLDAAHRRLDAIGAPGVQDLGFEAAEHAGHLRSASGRRVTMELVAAAQPWRRVGYSSDEGIEQDGIPGVAPHAKATLARPVSAPVGEGDSLFRWFTDDEWASAIREGWTEKADGDDVPF